MKPSAALTHLTRFYYTTRWPRRRNQLHLQTPPRSIRGWDHLIRTALHRTGQYLWPDRRRWGLWSQHDYRLRHRDDIWWIEHDLPPYDRYQCAAYQVHLIRGQGHDPHLTVHTDTAIYLVSPATWATLTTTLTRACADPPLVILRRMGSALDP
jgi:hypothetical protein